MDEARRIVTLTNLRVEGIDLKFRRLRLWSFDIINMPDPAMQACAFRDERFYSNSFAVLALPAEWKVE